MSNVVAIYLMISTIRKIKINIMLQLLHNNLLLLQILMLKQMKKISLQLNSNNNHLIFKIMFKNRIVQIKNIILKIHFNKKFRSF